MTTKLATLGIRRSLCRAVLRRNNGDRTTSRTLASIGSFHPSTLLPGNEIKNNTKITSGLLSSDFQGKIGLGKVSTVSESNDNASDCLAPYRISCLACNLDDDDGG